MQQWLGNDRNNYTDVRATVWLRALSVVCHAMHSLPHHEECSCCLTSAELNGCTSNEHGYSFQRLISLSSVSTDQLTA